MLPQLPTIPENENVDHNDTNSDDELADFMKELFENNDSRVDTETTDDTIDWGVIFDEFDSDDTDTTNNDESNDNVIYTFEDLAKLESELAHLSTKVVNRSIRFYRFTEEQVATIRAERRKYKNRESARRSSAKQKQSLSKKDKYIKKLEAILKSNNLMV